MARRRVQIVTLLLVPALSLALQGQRGHEKKSDDLDTAACHGCLKVSARRRMSIIASGDLVPRVLAVDVGGRRVGLAISDPSGTLARPLATIEVTGTADSVARVADEIGRLERDDDGLSAVVVGLPVRLDGSPGDETARVAAFIDALKTRTAVPIVTADERLTSREAESRLSVQERDWRRRKVMLDAAAAAIFLQDYLDRSRD